MILEQNLREISEKYPELDEAYEKPTLHSIMKFIEKRKDCKYYDFMRNFKSFLVKKDDEFSNEMQSELIKEYRKMLRIADITYNIKPEKQVHTAQTLLSNDTESESGWSVLNQSKTRRTGISMTYFDKDFNMTKKLPKPSFKHLKSLVSRDVSRYKSSMTIKKDLHFKKFSSSPINKMNSTSMFKDLQGVGTQDCFGEGKVSFTLRDLQSQNSDISSIFH